MADRALRDKDRFSSLDRSCIGAGEVGAPRSLGSLAELDEVVLEDSRLAVGELGVGHAIRGGWIDLPALARMAEEVFQPLGAKLPRGGTEVRSHRATASIAEHVTAAASVAARDLKRGPIAASALWRRH